MKSRYVSGALLLAVFIVEVIKSGVGIAWLILRRGGGGQAGLVRISFSGLSPWGASLLGAMITLTPGSTAIAIDYARGEMLLHLLDASDPGSVACEIQRRFEVPMRRIYPKGSKR